MALRLGVDLGIFRILVDQNGQPTSATELASSSQAEILLIGESKSFTLLN